MLGSIPSVDIGVREHTPGTSTDIEVDEIFVVLSGSATATADGEDSVEFTAGDAGVLTAGASTAWAMHETFRRTFISDADDESGDT